MRHQGRSVSEAGKSWCDWECTAYGKNIAVVPGHVAIMHHDGKREEEVQTEFENLEVGACHGVARGSSE